MIDVESRPQIESIEQRELIKLQQYDGAVGRLFSGNLDLKKQLSPTEVEAISVALVPGNELSTSVKDKIEQAQKRDRKNYYEGKAGTQETHINNFAINIREWVRTRLPDGDERVRFTKAMQAIHLDTAVLTADGDQAEQTGLDQIKSEFYNRYGSGTSEASRLRQTDTFINDVLNSCVSRNDFLNWMHYGDDVLTIFGENAREAVKARLYAEAQKKFEYVTATTRITGKIGRVNDPEPHEQKILNGIQYGQWVTTDQLTVQTIPETLPQHDHEITPASTHEQAYQWNRIKIIHVDSNPEENKKLNKQIMENAESEKQKLLESVVLAELSEDEKRKLEQAELKTNDFFKRKLIALGLPSGYIDNLSRPHYVKPYDGKDAGGDFAPRSDVITAIVNPEIIDLLYTATAAAHEKSHQATLQSLKTYPYNLSGERKASSLVGLERVDRKKVINEGLENGLAILDQVDVYNSLVSDFPEESRKRIAAKIHPAIEAKLKLLDRSVYGPVPRDQIDSFILLSQRGVDISEGPLKQWLLIREVCLAIGNDQNPSATPEEKINLGRTMLDKDRFIESNDGLNAIVRVLGNDTATLLSDIDDELYDEGTLKLQDKAMQIIKEKNILKTILPPEQQDVQSEEKIIGLQPKAFRKRQTESPITTTITEQEHRELLLNLPEENRKAAKLFCDNLRARLRNPNPTQSNLGFLFTDSQSGLQFHANNRNIDDAWFDTDDFKEWARINGLPIVYFMETNYHAKLLLKSPRVENGQIKMLIYDPLMQNEQEETFPINETLEAYKRRIINERSSNQVNDEMLRVKRQTSISDEALYINWLSEQLSRHHREVGANYQGNRMLVNGSYDLSLESDPQLPQELIAAKGQQFQNDGKNCVPLAFFSAALRYAAKNGKDQNPQIKSLVNKFQEDFNIRLLTRDELLAA